jgi:mRNA interferase YafQ
MAGDKASTEQSEEACAGTSLQDSQIRDIQQTSQFKKDYKRMKSRGSNMDLLREVIGSLQRDEGLPEKYQNHRLEGMWKNSFDCHIQPDWILVYRKTDDSLILQATGTHSDLFKK